MKVIPLFIALLLTSQLDAQPTAIAIPGKFNDPIPVLNVASFHMGETTDSHKTEFDEHNYDNVKRAHQIARMLAAFKPTVLIVETPPGYNPGLQKEYLEYLEKPAMKFDRPSEIELLAYEVGRLSGAKKIYGIDFKENYNYKINELVRNSSDSSAFYRYMQMANNYAATNYEEAKPLLDVFRWINQPGYLDFMINVNADILTHISSEGRAEGADQAAMYYHRNLVMYSNLNQIPLTKDDRVFILMGASHTAFFTEFMKRSPKYKLVDVLSYLN